MMKYILILIFIFSLSVFAVGQTRDLLYAIEHKADYEQIKEQRINALMQDLAKKNQTLERHYEINSDLYNEYKAYRIDSAIFYLEKNLTIAQKTQNRERECETVIALSFMYWQSGKYFEAFGLLNDIDKNILQTLPKIRYAYYEAYKQISRYYAEAQSDSKNPYFEMSRAYRDSVLIYAPPQTQVWKMDAAEKLAEQQRWDDAAEIMLNLMDEQKYQNHNYAICASILADIYRQQGNVELQKRYFELSALADTKNAVKENTAMLQLALLLYEEGDIDNAYRCIKSAMSDALFCNARFRTYRVAAIFPIIDSAYQDKVAKQRRELFIYLILVSILSFWLVIAIVFIYRYLKRISKIRLQLAQTNGDLQNKNLTLNSLNAELTELNRRLSETNIVKETYLTKFIDLCSHYIEKLDNYRRSLHRLARDNKAAELNAELKSSKFIESELADFYINFDETFLRIFPTFVADFNALFPSSEQQTLKTGEMLNTELRIFALVRLGIHDSQQIASFLRCSITTVYTYRSKLKNRSLFKENLEEKILRIGM